MTLNDKRDLEYYLVELRRDYDLIQNHLTEVEDEIQSLGKRKNELLVEQHQWVLRIKDIADELWKYK